MQRAFIANIDYPTLKENIRFRFWKYLRATVCGRFDFQLRMQAVKWKINRFSKSYMLCAIVGLYSV